jgi:hypothetical protein
MNVAGIDYSTQAIDLVLVDIDDGDARLFHWDLCAGDAFARTRAVPLVVPGRRAAFWDTVCAVGIEEPFGRGPSSWAIVPKLKAIQGAILACIPAEMEVTPLAPAEWRKAVGLSGNAPKEHVTNWARRHKHIPFTWPQDAYDAYCIARAIDEGKVAA